MADHNSIGKWGEKVARDLYASKGAAIIEYNWHSGHYEIDVIAQRGNRLIFAEVKTRKEGSPDGLLAFNPRKQRRLACAADAFIRMMGKPMEYQFDYIGITGTEHNYTVEHLEDIYINMVNMHPRRK